MICLPAVPGRPILFVLLVGSLGAQFARAADLIVEFAKDRLDAAPSR